MIDLRHQRRLDRQFRDLGLERCDRGVRLDHIGLGDAAFLDRVAGDGLFVGKLGLLPAAAGHVEARGRLVELLDRSEIARRQLLGAVVGLLRQPLAGLGRGHGRLALGDDLGASADLDALEIGQRDGLRGLRLLEPGQQFGIVDRHQDLARGDVLAAIHRAPGNAAVDPRRDVDPRGIRLALNQQRLRLNEIPKRQGEDRDHGKRNDGDRRPRRLLWRVRAVVRPLFHLCCARAQPLQGADHVSPCGKNGRHCKARARPRRRAHIHMLYATLTDPLIASASAQCNKMVAHHRAAIYIDKQPGGCI